MHGREIERHLQKRVAWMPMLTLLTSWSPAAAAAAVGWERRCGKLAVHRLTMNPHSDCSPLLDANLQLHADLLLRCRNPPNFISKIFLPLPTFYTMFAARTAASRFVARSLVSSASRGMTVLPTAVTAQQPSLIRSFATVSIFFDVRCM